MAYAAGVSRELIELTALDAANLDRLAAFLDTADGKGALAGFGRVSLHGPALHLEAGWPALLASLDGLELPSDAPIVLHPDTLADPSQARVLGARATFENMDVRKRDGRTARELERAFDAAPDAGFCLDVAHVRTIDPSLEEGRRLLDAFGDRLRQVHVSGIEPDGTHRPTTDADMDTYRPLLERCAGAPWVFEAPPPPGWATGP